MLRRMVLWGLLVIVLVACGGGGKVLPEADAQAFADQVAPTTENLLTGLSNQDEAAYTRDMVQKMKDVSTGEQFTQVYDSIIGKIGKYVSAEMQQVVESDGYRSVIYTAKFEDEEKVTVRVVYDVSGSTPLVAGLWLDSPKLRQK